MGPLDEKKKFKDLVGQSLQGCTSCLYSFRCLWENQVEVENGVECSLKNSQSFVVSLPKAVKRAGGRLCSLKSNR
jgi:uncharacterized protein involved in tolerance to divalent cations